MTRTRRPMTLPLAAALTALCGFATASAAQTAAMAAGAAATPSSAAAAIPPLLDHSLSELRDALDHGQTTSVQLVEAYLARIRAVDQAGPALHAVLAINPGALDDARARDRERAAHQLRGPLHGLPILIKDNIETADKLPTTAGSLALAANFAGRDAPIIAALRASGAIILGKTNLSEWANFRSTHSTSGWSAVGGLTRNPYVLDRSACGSSAGSGAGIAAGLGAAALGTETDGSVTCPASMNGLVGLKPTVGLLAQTGIVPISHSQDTAGPMTRSVRDAALLMDAMTGGTNTYTRGLDRNALRGKRLGVWRFKEDTMPAIDPLYARALDELRKAGAILVDVPVPDTAPAEAAEGLLLHVEFKADLNHYLAGAAAAVKTRTLADLIAFNQATPAEMTLFGQEIFLQSERTNGLADPAYLKAVADAHRLAADEGIIATLTANRLDALVAPTAGPAWRVDTVTGDNSGSSFTTLPAVAGFPHLSVPMGELRGLPVGLSFIGRPSSEAELLAFGFAFESVHGAAPRPRYLPTLETGPASH